MKRKRNSTIHLRNELSRLFASLYTMQKRFSHSDLQKNSINFKLRFGTMHKTWINHFTPETKQQTKQWVEASGSTPKTK